MSKNSYHSIVFITVRILVLVAALLLTIGQGVQATGHSKILHVANNGLDSPACGAFKSPCRSISQAISNAPQNGTVIVGPGRYGDLNGNGVFGELGEEAAPQDCLCMIKINKRLKILSREGALATVLDAGGAIMRVVAILADDVTFGGKKGKGFTVTGSGSGTAGVSVNGNNIQVTGNLALNNGLDGFGIFGDRNSVTHNVAMGNGQNGFGIFGTNNQLKHNHASLNSGGGFFVFGGSGHFFRTNVAVGNDFGFGVAALADMKIERASAVGNKDTGVLVLGTSDAEVRTSNIFGNGDDPINPPSNCGLTNASDIIDATKNFWGAATGPGPNPADNICNFGNAETDTDPVSRKEFRNYRQPLL